MLNWVILVTPQNDFPIPLWVDCGSVFLNKLNIHFQESSRRSKLDGAPGRIPVGTG